MRNFTDILEALQLTPEQRRRRENLKAKRRKLAANGQDTSEIDAELATLGGYTPKGGTSVASGPSPAAKPAGPTKKPAGMGKDWDEGYKAAIEAIKKAQSGQQGGSGSGGGGNGLAPIPSNPDNMDQDGQQGSQGSGSSQGSSGQGSSGGSGQSRNGKQKGQGVVRPEDCIQPGGGGDLNDTPSAAGGMISKETGDAISQAEGYDKSPGSEDSQAKNWSEWAQDAMKGMPPGVGEGWAKLRAKIASLYKTTKDWKKELKKIIGQCISPDDKRSAYANKNILVSQDRVARTDKDKYDSVDYMVAAIDTSGSMSQKYLQQCLNEVYQVALAKKPLKLVVIQFDTRIADIQEFTNLNDLKRKLNDYQLVGGGGTDVKPVFDLLKNDPKYKRRPAELLMIFTDGYLEQYKRDPKHERSICWVIVDDPTWEVKYKDINTKCVRISSADFK